MYIHFQRLCLLVTLGFALPTCTNQQIDLSPPIKIEDIPNTDQFTYSWLKENVFGICTFCHMGRRPYVMHHKMLMEVVKPGLPEKSRLYYMVRSGRMPKGGRLTDKQISAIYYWIKDGAKNN